MRFHSLSQKQNGVVLFIALIALVAMMAAAVALTNSVDTGAQISTNRFLAQSAQSSADVGFAAMKLTLLNELGGNSLSSDAALDKLQNKWKCYHPYAFISTSMTVDTRKDENEALSTTWGEATRLTRKMEGTDLDGKRYNLNAFVTRSALPEPITVGDPIETGAGGAPSEDHVCKIVNPDLGETIYYMADLQCPDGRKSSGGFTMDCLYPNSFAPSGSHDKSLGQEHQIGLLLNDRSVLRGRHPDPTKGERGIGFQGFGFHKVTKNQDNQDIVVTMPDLAMPLIRVTVRVDGPRNTRTYRQQVIGIFQNLKK